MTLGELMKAYTPINVEVELLKKNGELIGWYNRDNIQQYIDNEVHTFVSFEVNNHHTLVIHLLSNNINAD